MPPPGHSPVLEGAFGVYFVGFGGLFCCIWQRVRPTCCPLVERSQLQGSASTGSKPRAESREDCIVPGANGACLHHPPSPPEPLHLLQMDFWGEIVRVCRPPGVSCSTALGVERSFQGSGLLCLCAILGGGGEGVLLHPPRWHRAVGQISVPRGGPHRTTAHRSEGRRGGEKQEGRDGNSRPKPPQRQTPGKKLISNLPFYYLLFYLKKKKSFNKALCFCSNLILLPGPGFSRLSLSLSLSPTPLPSCSSSSSRR